MPALIRNQSIEPCALPYPFRGVLRGMQVICVDLTADQVITALGGAAVMVGTLRVTDIATTGPFDSTYVGDAALGLNGSVGSLAIASKRVAFGNTAGTGLTSDAGLTYDPAADILGVTGTVASSGNHSITNSIAGAKTIGVDATALAVNGAGASLTLQGGAPGAADAATAGGVSGAVTVTSRIGGVGSALQVGGASGVVTLTSGAGGVDGGGGGANSGEVAVDSGAPSGAGTGGVVSVGATNANSVTVGRAGKATTVPGTLGVGAAPVASAVLAATSTTRGFLPPVVTTTQRDAIAAPAEGLIVYNITTHKLNVRVAAAWEAITSV